MRWLQRLAARVRLTRHLLAYGVRDHSSVVFRSSSYLRFLGCSCGEEFYHDKDDLPNAYHVGNFVRSWEIKRKIRDARNETSRSEA